MARSSGRFSVLLAFSLLLAASCGDGSSPDSDGGGLDGSRADGGRLDAGTGGPITEEQHASFVARAWCDVQVECDCEADRAACLMSTEARLVRNTELLRSMGLTYDSSCASELAGWLAIRGCHGFMPREQLLPCALYHGDVPEGSECRQLTTGASDCARGLLCLPNEDRTLQLCQDPSVVLPNIAPAGEACGGTTGASCDPLGAFCNPDGICQDFPAAGEACDRGNCRLGAYCDRDTDTCVVSLARGEACADGTVCETLSCDEGACSSFCYAPPL